MSKSYRKYIKCGIAAGNNTEYYRNRNRKERTINKQNLRNLINKLNIDDVDNAIMFIPVPYDDWMEPTDGHILVNKNSNEYDYLPKKYKNQLKSKRYKH